MFRITIIIFRFVINLLRLDIRWRWTPRFTQTIKSNHNTGGLFQPTYVFDKKQWFLLIQILVCFLFIRIGCSPYPIGKSVSYMYNIFRNVQGVVSCCFYEATCSSLLVFHLLDISFFFTRETRSPVQFTRYSSRQICWYRQCLNTGITHTCTYIIYQQ